MATELSLDEIYGTTPSPRSSASKWQIDPAVQAARDAEAAGILQQELRDPRVTGDPEMRAATVKTLARVQPGAKPQVPTELNLDEIYSDGGSTSQKPPAKSEPAAPAKLPYRKQLMQNLKDSGKEVASIGDMVISLPWGLASAVGSLGMYAEMQALGLDRRGAAEASREFGDHIAGAAPKPLTALVNSLANKEGEEPTPTTVEKAMEKMVGWIEKGATIVDKKTGGALTKDEVMMEANLLMNALGAKALTGATKRGGKPTEQAKVEAPAVETLPVEQVRNPTNLGEVRRAHTMGEKQMARVQQKYKEFVEAQTAAAKPTVAEGAVAALPEEAPVKMPEAQSGKASTELLTGIATAGLGGLAGWNLSEDGSLGGAIFGALATGALGTSAGRAVLKRAAEAPDYALGAVSTRLGNIHPSLKRSLRDHELTVFKRLEESNTTILPFLTEVGRLSNKAREDVSLAVYNRTPANLATQPKVQAVFPAVQQQLAKIETELKSLGRFGQGLADYFPRVVSDLDGLKAHLGGNYAQGIDAALVKAEAQMIQKQNRGLTDVERSIVVNQYLAAPTSTSHLPGFAKPRAVPQVTRDMLKFYEPVDVSLLRYTSAAIADVAKAKFFGKDLVTKKKNGRLFTNLDGSIGNMTARLLKSGQIDQKQALQLRDMLKARFEGGEQSMTPVLAATRNLTNMALLGNITSAATQVGDSLMVVYHFGVVPSVKGVAQKIMGRSKVTPKDLGLVNHVAEELADKGFTGKALQKTLAMSGFKAIDMFAKGVTLNAAMTEGARAVRSPKGELRFRQQYSAAYGTDINQLVKDLKSGKRTDLTDSYAFSRLSDAQPVSKAEMPEAYLRHPNGRLLYQLKTYMLKQTDIVRRDAYQEIASGNPVRIARGVKNLLALGTMYALANVPGDILKDVISGRPVELPDQYDLFENVLQTFGVNRYTQERLGQGKVVETVQQMVTPPVRVIQDVVTGKERSVAYAPLVGRAIYDRELGGNEKREIAENRSKFGPGKPLSPEAKKYLREERQRRQKEKREAAFNSRMQHYKKQAGLE